MSSSTALQPACHRGATAENCSVGLALPIWFTGAICQGGYLDFQGFFFFLRIIMSKFTGLSKGSF